MAAHDSESKPSAGARCDTGFLHDRIEIDPSAWIAPGAVIAGVVSVGRETSIWYGCVLRGDLEPIVVGEHSNIQDLTVVHVDRRFPARIGNRVTVGHRALLHGCVIEDDTLIGMGAVLLTGCQVGRGALVAAGAVVREGFEVPPRTIAAGVPARIIGPVNDTLAARIADGVRDYLAGTEAYRSGRLGRSPYGGARTSDLGADRGRGGS